jgi:hypothetical protein
MTTYDGLLLYESPANSTALNAGETTFHAMADVRKLINTAPVPGS